MTTFEEQFPSLKNNVRTLAEWNQRKKDLDF